ncbi:T9SS type A sorting domain-containing protein, partial [candidate division KSB1 bacterium]|nr:T9SS type A sorting domain-containing protein [candidate division KSB1 bacterium]
RYATHCKLGDINMDGVLTPGDAQCAFQMYMQQGEISEDNACYTPCLTRSSDANCDGNITPADALRIFTAYLNGDSVLTCEGLNKKAVCPPAMTAHLEQDGRRLIVPVSCEQAIALTAFGMVVEYPADFYEFSTLRRGSITLDWTRLDGYEKQPGELWIGGFTLPGIKHPATANDLLSLEFSLKGDKQPAGEIKIREFLDDLAGASSLTLKIAARKENLLAYNFPNPFNASTTIKYELVSNQHIRIDIYDIRGQLVRRLLDSRRERGEHVVVWNGSDLRGHEVPSGIYYGVIHSDSLKKTFKMLVIR